LTATLALSLWAIDPIQARVPDSYCRSDADTAAVAVGMVQDVVSSTEPRDSKLRSSLGVQAAADTNVVLVVDEARCRRAIDTLNALAARAGGTASTEGIYLVSTGSSYAVYAPRPGESTGLIFLDSRFRFLGVVVVP
jgi:hypothetical protein